MLFSPPYWWEQTPSQSTTTILSLRPRLSYKCFAWSFSWLSICDLVRLSLILIFLLSCLFSVLVFSLFVVSLSCYINCLVFFDFVGVFSRLYGVWCVLSCVRAREKEIKCRFKPDDILVIDNPAIYYLRYDVAWIHMLCRRRVLAWVACLCLGTWSFGLAWSFVDLAWASVCSSNCLVLSSLIVLWSCLGPVFLGFIQVRCLVSRSFLAGNPNFFVSSWSLMICWCLWAAWSSRAVSDSPVSPFFLGCKRKLLREVLCSLVWTLQEIGPDMGFPWCCEIGKCGRGKGGLHGCESRVHCRGRPWIPHVEVLQKWRWRREVCRWPRPRVYEVLGCGKVCVIRSHAQLLNPRSVL